MIQKKSKNLWFISPRDQTQKDKENSTRNEMEKKSEVLQTDKN